MEQTQSTIASHPKYLTMKQAAARIGVSYWTFFRFVKDGIVPTIHLTNRTKRFDPERLDKWLSERSTQGRT